MKSIFITIVIIALSISIVAQPKDTSRIINSAGIGNIKTGQKLKKRQLQIFSRYDKTVRFHKRHEGPHFTKVYSIEDGLLIYLRKKLFGFSYKIQSISIKYPFKGVTDKGIEVGVAKMNDVIEKYGTPDDISGDMYVYNFKTGNHMYFYFDQGVGSILSEIKIY